MISKDILSLIPQRPPFVMVDGLIESGEKTTRSVFRITADNIFVENGFFCEPGLVENIAQTAAARAGYQSVTENQPVRLGYIGSVKNLVISSLPKINDEIITEITLENQIFDVSVISARVRCKEMELASCEMKIFIQNQ